MRGSSADSFARLSQQQRQAIADGADATRLAEDLFQAVAVFRSEAAFRRAATDPTTDSDARSALLRDVFGKHFGETATELVSAAGSMRWVTGMDLVDTLEQLGVIAVARAADAAGEGDRLESELFGFGQTISENPTLRAALTNRTRSVEDKQKLLRSLLEGKASPGTVRLAEQAVAGNYVTVRRAFDDYARIATESRGRIVALVKVAEPLADKDRTRLSEVLGRQYGKPVHLNIVIDPEVLGGIHVEVGDEMIDGTISTKLGEAGRRLAG